MDTEKKLCLSVFKNGAVNKEEYTAIWIDIVNHLIKDRRAFASTEERK